MRKIILTFILLLLLSSGFISFDEVQGQEWPQWDEESKLSLGQCIVGECDFKTEREAAALGHTLVKIWRVKHKRFRWSLRTTIHTYCAAFDERGRNYNRPRTKSIRESTWDEPLHRPGNDPDWTKLREFVARFQRQEIVDPCPKCVGWVGNTDIIPPTWTVVMGPPKYENKFCVRAN